MAFDGRVPAIDWMQQFRAAEVCRRQRIRISQLNVFGLMDEFAIQIASTIARSSSFTIAASRTKLRR